MKKDISFRSLKEKREKIKLIQINRNTFLNQLKSLPLRLKTNNESKFDINGKIIDLSILHIYQLIQQLSKLQQQYVNKLPSVLLGRVRQQKKNIEQHEKYDMIIEEMADVEHFIRHSCVLNSQKISIIDHRCICQFLLKLKPQRYKMGDILYIDQSLTRFQRTMYQLKPHTYDQCRESKFALQFPYKYDVQEPTSLAALEQTYNNNQGNQSIEQSQSLSSFFDEPYCQQQHKKEEAQKLKQKQKVITSQKVIKQIEKEKKNDSNKTFFKVWHQSLKQKNHQGPTPYQYQIREQNQQIEDFQPSAIQKNLKIQTKQKKQKKGKQENQQKNPQKQKSQIKKNKRQAKLMQKLKKQSSLNYWGLYRDINEIRFMQEIKAAIKKKNNEIQRNYISSEEEDEVEALKKEKRRIFKFQQKLNQLSFINTNIGTRRWGSNQKKNKNHLSKHKYQMKNIL